MLATPPEDAVGCPVVALIVHRNLPSVAILGSGVATGGCPDLVRESMRSFLDHNQSAEYPNLQLCLPVRKARVKMHRDCQRNPRPAGTLQFASVKLIPLRGKILAA